MTLSFYAEREYLSPPHSLMLLGGWAALFTSVAALWGAWLAPYNAKVQAPAVVRPVGELGLERSGEVTADPQSSFVIKAWIPNGGISSLELGQMAQMRLQSCPYPTYGVLAGEVSAIAMDTTALTPAALSAAAPVSSGDLAGVGSRYEVLIQPQANALESLGGQSCELRAGMEGRVDILLGQERLLSYLMRKARLGAI